MEIKIIERKENKLLNREEVYAVAEHPGEATPKREEIRKKIAAMVGSDENLTVVTKILSSYRLPISKIWVNVYRDQETMKRLEPKHILKRNGLAE
jgi:small subunit ribosomal protein S24e